jgi:hypothetical protein
VILEEVGGTPPPPPLQSDVIINGGFEADGIPWVFYTNSTGSFATDAPGQTSAHAAHVRVETAGTNVQLYQPGLTFNADAWYTLRFKAYSKTGHDMSVHIHKHGSPYTDYGLDGWTVPLGPAWAEYSRTFQTRNFTGTVNDGRLRLWLAPFAADGDEYFVDDVSLTLNSGSGIPAKETVSQQSSDTGPGQSSLLQNFPNPFNPVTNIRFTLVTREKTTIQVYDILGREVATLVNEVKEPGSYTVVFDASNLPSGVYLYRMKAGSIVQTKRLTVVK